MEFYTIVTVLCLACMVVGTGFVVFNLLRRDRAGRIGYVRGFKRGKGALIYLFALPLYWIGNGYTGMSFIDGLFDAIRRLVDLVVLKYDLSPVAALMRANALFAVTVYICFVLVACNAVLFASSLASQHFWSYFFNLYFRHSKRERLVLFGNNAHNHCIYESEGKRLKTVVGRIEGEEAARLYARGIHYTSILSLDKYIERTIERAVGGKRTVVVVNTECDEKDMEICRRFIKRIAALSETEQDICFEQLKIFVFGDPRYEAIYVDIMSDGQGCISYINKYQRTAVDFIDRYPFTRFMDERHIDHNTSLVKEGVELNAVFIGFGKANQQIFLTSVANNQFICKGENGVAVKKVKYHIFDKDIAENNKNLNHSYKRYKYEFEGADPNEYLPLPDYPAEECYHQVDVNDVSFYQLIRRAAESRLGVTFVVISFGSDLENIDMAQKLSLKFREWEIENVVIFVRVREGKLGKRLLEGEDCYLIGNELETIYDIENILGDNVFKMAQMRNEVYDLEYELTKVGNAPLGEAQVEAIKAKAYHDWYKKKSQLERDSSLYGCLSLRSKLHMMGLDYCPQSEAGRRALSEAEYLQVYAQDDQPDFGYYTVKADGKPIAHYTLEFKESRRKALAVHEHLRWNAFMISKGMVPASKKIILEERAADGRFTNGKNYEVRRHGNITTFEGLEEFRRMIAERDRAAEETLEQAEARKDVIKYDYQLLDDAYWLLNKNGYKIVKK